ncbi:MAG: sodium-dependent bicarbonate transport family permease [Planctomycetales bacterium]
MLQTFIHNVMHNMFKPLLLFFYAGFAMPLLGVKLEFPKVLYQSLTIYLLLAIGWHGGEELASLPPSMYGQAAGFMVLGFISNTIIGTIAFFTLKYWVRLRQVDAATVAGYYGSDSAGTFVTCIGVLTAAHIPFAAYMPVMLAIMEIPGCLVALYIVSKLRQRGMDELGNTPGDPNYAANRAAMKVTHVSVTDGISGRSVNPNLETDDGQPVEEDEEEELVAVGAESRTVSRSVSKSTSTIPRQVGPGRNGHGGADHAGSNGYSHHSDSEPHGHAHAPKAGGINAELLHEVFLNPGIFLLFAGIAIGFISRLQGEKVIAANDIVFVNLFQGMLCLFLLEMGMTASNKLKDLKTAGWKFIVFGLLAPNVFATFGMFMAHAYAQFTGVQFEMGTYVVFAVLCGAASYIAVPAVQRLAIPEASPTLPLAASLGLTFSYNVTLGIPVYMMISEMLVKYVHFV